MTRPKKSRKKRPKPRRKVVLIALPPGFIDDLPAEDQRAITAMVGKPVLLVKYDEIGRAELHFRDPFIKHCSHRMWVDPKFITALRE